MTTATKKKPAAKKTTAKKPAKPKAEKKPKTKSLDELKAAHYKKICELNKQVSISLTQSDNDSRTAKDSKKRYEALASSLVDLIASDPSQRELEFPQDSGQAVPQADWKKIPIAELGIAKSWCEKLAAEHIGTLGQLDEFWKSGKMLNDIKGIGDETAGKIADAYAEFGTKNPHIFAEKKTAAEPAATEQTDDSLKEEMLEEFDKRGILAK